MEQMKVPMELVNNIAKFAGLHPLAKIIFCILTGMSTARKHNRVCRQFAQWVEMISDRLELILEDPERNMHPATRHALDQLGESLEQAYLLVNKYKDRSYGYRFFMGPSVFQKFHDKQKEIMDSIQLVNMITGVTNQIMIYDARDYQAIRPVYRHYPGMEIKDQKKGSNKEQMGQKKDGRRDKDTEKGKTKERKGKEENDKVQEKQRAKRNKEKMKKNGREEEKDRGRGKNEKRKNGHPAVWDDCLKPLKYSGVENVTMEMDKLILSMAVVGHSDTKTSRNYVANNTNKEIDLNIKRGRKRDDDLKVLEKTGKDSKNIGREGKSKGGNSNKKYVMPMIPAKVVLMVGGSGLHCCCLGHMGEIRNGLSKIEGVQHVDIDQDKNQVTVTGTTMDTNTLLKRLGKILRGRPVEVWSG